MTSRQKAEAIAWSKYDAFYGHIYNILQGSLRFKSYQFGIEIVQEIVTKSKYSTSFYLPVTRDIMRFNMTQNLSKIQIYRLFVHPNRSKYLN